MELCKIYFHKFKDNLSQTEQAALTSLHIKKGGQIYHCCGSELRQSCSRRTRAIIHKDMYNTQDIHSPVNKVVIEMHINSNIDRITHKYLPQPLKFHPGSLYLLPKIHKILKSSKDVRPCSVKCLYLSGQSYLNAPPLQC